MIALIDADVVAYRCAASCEPTKEKHEREPIDLAISRADELLYRILSDTQSEKYRLFLSGTENFRKYLYPQYKANREHLPRPAWLEPVREFLVTEWKAEVVSGCEADDGIGIAANEDTLICTNDKDLLQIPGLHFNFVTGEFHNLDEAQAALAFWSSMLLGDSSDNLPGIPGLGKVKSKRYLEGLSPKEMESAVRGLYSASGLDYVLHYKLYRIVRSEEELEERLNEAYKCKAEREATTEASSKENSGDLP
jgi:DNA polymerase-1